MPWLGGPPPDTTPVRPGTLLTRFSISAVVTRVMSTIINNVTPWPTVLVQPAVLWILFQDHQIDDPPSGLRRIENQNALGLIEIDAFSSNIILFLECAHFSVSPLQVSYRAIYRADPPPLSLASMRPSPPRAALLSVRHSQRLAAPCQQDLLH